MPGPTVPLGLLSKTSKVGKALASAAKPVTDSLCTSESLLSKRIEAIERLGSLQFIINGYIVTGDLGEDAEAVFDGTIQIGSPGHYRRSHTPLSFFQEGHPTAFGVDVNHALATMPAAQESWAGRMWQARWRWPTRADEYECCETETRFPNTAK